MELNKEIAKSPLTQSRFSDILTKLEILDSFIGELESLLFNKSVFVIGHENIPSPSNPINEEAAKAPDCWLDDVVYRINSIHERLNTVMNILESI